MRSSPFAFYEEVRVKAGRAGLEEVAGELGAVLGSSQDGERWSYAILIYSRGATWGADEDDLVSTGRIRTREEFYDGAAVRVSEDGQLLD
ncbi:Imm31 family immunity protein [Luteolibacter sp. GHJ8]|uniref:Imm31 family immunity protein n=2 Tax=Luteolibacter rhizosphaerae TaxID=2989719 RepID=A0ABT3G8K8_9BACT|nr:Imm31 family immunity protein [Luteolibacter rhizosphaerae]